MKSILSSPTSPAFARRAALSGRPWLAGCLSLLVLGSLARADIPEPDNILYGTLVIGTDFITAARTDVVVEARRAPSGTLVASYRMGSDAALGDFYILRIPVEAAGPVTNPDASLAGQDFDIILRDGSGLQGQDTFTLLERGQVQRVNFGTPAFDSDGNGLPDAWELARFGSIGQDPSADSDNDGQSNESEWIAGSHPLDPQDNFKLQVNYQAGLMEVRFVALRAEGPGYEGRTRRYTLESSFNLFPGSWTQLPGYTDLTGNNQTVLLQVPGTGANPEFIRGQVNLSVGP